MNRNSRIARRSNPFFMHSPSFLVIGRKGKRGLRPLTVTFSHIAEPVFALLQSASSASDAVGLSGFPAYFVVSFPVVPFLPHDLALLQIVALSVVHPHTAVSVVASCPKHLLNC